MAATQELRDSCLVVGHDDQLKSSSIWQIILQTLADPTAHILVIASNQDSFHMQPSWLLSATTDQLQRVHVCFAPDPAELNFVLATVQTQSFRPCLIVVLDLRRRFSQGQKGLGDLTKSVALMSDAVLFCQPCRLVVTDDDDLWNPHHRPQNKGSNVSPISPSQAGYFRELLEHLFPVRLQATQ